MTIDDLDPGIMRRPRSGKGCGAPLPSGWRVNCTEGPVVAGCVAGCRSFRVMSCTGSVRTADFDPGIMRRPRWVDGGVTGPDFELGITVRSSAVVWAVVGAAPAGFVLGVGEPPLR